MENKYFLSQVRRTNGDYSQGKGVVVHNTKDAAINAFHAYFAAYGNGHDENTDYVACFISDMSGAIIKSEVWNAIPVEPEPVSE